MISTPLSMFSTIENDEQRNELSDIYEENFKMFYSIALKLLQKRQDAEDALQEAFMSIAENPDLLFNVPQEKRVVYIKSIVRNISYRIWRKRTNTEKIQVEIDEDMPDSGISVDELIAGECSRDDIYKYIDTFPEETQTAIYLKFHFGMKNADIARQLGSTEEAIKKRIERASDKIRKYVEDYNND